MCVRAFSEKGLFFFFFLISLAIPGFGLLSHISFLRLSAGHSGPVLTLRTYDATCTSLPNPHLLLADASVCTVSPWVVGVRNIFSVSLSLCVCVSG